MINMKKLLNIIFLLLVFAIPTKVFGLTGTISLECDSFTKKVGENISCTLYGNSTEGVSAVETTLVYNDSIVLSDASASNIWQGDYENKSLLLYTDSNKTNKFELMSFKVTSNEVGTKALTFSNAYFTDASFNRNQILNPNYTFEFISEEQAEENNNQTIPVIVPDENNTENNDNNKTDDENPGTGSFISVSLLVFLTGLGIIIFFKTRNKQIYKI